ncbi:hypothetical protein, partial [Amycolatopsis sp. NPDC059020]|uniref:hypothetical protein n=1 Tax=Amycolatopsis sp. NPDC059020 TaxID=3346703 RepID=UPI0036730843
MPDVPRDAFGALDAPRDALVALNAPRASLGTRPRRVRRGLGWVSFVDLEVVKGGITGVKPRVVAVNAWGG